MPEMQASLARFFRHEACLHPNANPKECGRIVDAHTIQRSRALSAISDSTGHVLTFELDPQSGQLSADPVRIGWRRASTFRGFCHQHDQVFAPLESRPFVGDALQCFLAGYRALCHEVHQKLGSVRARSYVRDVIDRGQPPEVQTDLQAMHFLFEIGVRLGLRDVMLHKKAADQALLTGDLSSWSDCRVRFHGTFCIASTGAPTPDHDLTGNRIQDLMEPEVPAQPLLYSIEPDPQGDGGWFVFSWYRDHEAPRLFLSSLLLEAEKLPDLLLEFVFAHVANTFISSEWWLTLPGHRKRNLRRLAAMTDPYPTHRIFSGERFLDWRLGAVAWRN